MARPGVIPELSSNKFIRGERYAYSYGLDAIRQELLEGWDFLVNEVNFGRRSVEILKEGMRVRGKCVEGKVSMNMADHRCS